MDDFFSTIKSKAIKDGFLKLFFYTKTLVINPKKALVRLPGNNVPWLSFIAFATVASIFSGFLFSVFTLSPLAFVVAFTIFPLTVLASIALFSGFLYYFFLFFLERTESLKLLVSLSIFSTLPILITHPLSAWWPGIYLLGCGVSGGIIYLALRQSFKVNKKLAGRLVLILIGVSFFMWLVSILTSYRP